MVLVPPPEPRSRLGRFTAEVGGLIRGCALMAGFALLYLTLSLLGLALFVVPAYLLTR